MSDTLTIAVKEAVKEAVREEFAALGMQQPVQREGDRLLTKAEAAKLLGMSQDWLQRHADTLPFTRRPTPHALRFSYLGIQKWIKTR